MGRVCMHACFSLLAEARAAGGSMETAPLQQHRKGLHAPSFLQPSNLCSSSLVQHSGRLRLRGAAMEAEPSWVVQDELACNPFLRCSEPSLAAYCGLPASDPVAVLAELRRRKDNFGLVPSVVSGVLSAVTYCKPALRYLGIDQ